MKKLSCAVIAACAAALCLSTLACAQPRGGHPGGKPPVHAEVRRPEPHREMRPAPRPEPRREVHHAPRPVYHHRRVVAMRGGSAYHEPGCRFLPRRGRPISMDVREAERRGYRPCRTCQRGRR